MTTTDLSNTSYGTTLRTTLAGSLRKEHAGQHVKLGGWVHRARNLGGIIFVDLRDRAGILQVSFNPNWTSPEVLAQAASLGAESVVLVEGEIALRPEEMRNDGLDTGDIELRATRLSVPGPAQTPAIPVALGKGEKLPAEELRLKYRYLDLRRSELHQNIVLRHRLAQVTRRYLDEHGYLEIETPILTKPTPEGARDYLVPSRVNPGEFYALPQSPQLYKQLLMMAGFDRYFQIARCFRDEDLRADRQPEFTQIDIEGSFITREDIFKLTEGLFRVLFKEAGIDLPATIDVMTYDDAMERFGCDRPDLRYGLEIVDCSELFRNVDFGITKSALDQGGRVRGIRVPGGAALSRKQVDEIEAAAKSMGAGGLLRLKLSETGLEGPAAKFLPEDSGEKLGMQVGDLYLFAAGPDHITSPSLDKTRQELARTLQLIPDGMHAFIWVTDFPLFIKDEKSGELMSVHHPFTAPNPDDVHMMDTSPEKVRALAYDIVYNGTELGGGSIRISNPELQIRVLRMLGFDDETAQARFGFLLEALSAGAPPHGGIALGFDRIAMMLAGATSLRDVIAFPKTTTARALFEGAPSQVPAKDLKELHITIT